jgi:23S rRNA (guanine745-N1)-methyltransferase
MTDTIPAPWSCPVCSESLIKQDRTYRCQNAHSFDCAREGYVNLLLAHRKRSASPGDDRQMLNSRRSFLQQGYYQPLADAVANNLCKIASQAGEPLVILDLGCGEGYYCGQIDSALQQDASHAGYSLNGIDISKDAVRMASKRYGHINFAVASNAEIPMCDQQVHCLLEVFAPTYIKEIKRVVSPGGYYLRVTPGRRHLYTLRTLVYDRPDEHQLASTDLEGFNLLEGQRIHGEIAITGQEHVAELLAMTPYYWQASREKQLAIGEIACLSTEIDFSIDLFQRC